MKKIIILLVVVAGTITGLAYWTGTKIETMFPAALDKAAQLGQVQIEVSDYRRGIFRSSVQTSLTILSLEGKPEALNLRHDIWHGPFPFGKSRNGSLQLKPMAAFVETTFDREAPPPGDLGELFALFPDLFDSLETTRFSFDGSSRSEFTIPPFSQQVDDDGNVINIDWQGLSGEANVDASMTTMNGTVSIPRINMRDNESDIEFNNMASDFTIFLDPGGLLLGNVTANLATITVNDRNTAGVDFTLKDFQFRNAAKLQDQLASYSIAIGIEALEQDGQTYGPAGFELDFSNLNAAAILEIQERLKRLQSELTDLSEEQITNKILSIYMEKLPALISDSPRITLNYLNMKGPNGDLWGKGMIEIDGQQATGTASYGGLMQMLKAEADFRIHENILRRIMQEQSESSLRTARDNGQLGDVTEAQIEEMATEMSRLQLQQMLDQNILARDAGGFTITIRIADGVANLNGKPIPLQ